MYRMAVYGKGGIGKSTTVSNVAAALAADGMTVLQIGCDPKADSTIAHTAGVRIQSVLDVLRHKNASAVRLEDIVTRARDGVWCAEAGGPTPGTGCAGRGIVAAFESLTTCRAFEEIKPDVVLYDVLGDVVCGGFAMPIRKGYAENVFIVTSGENMAVYAAGNIAMAVQSYKNRGYPASFSTAATSKTKTPRWTTLPQPFRRPLSTGYRATVSCRPPKTRMQPFSQPFPTHRWPRTTRRFHVSYSKPQHRLKALRSSVFPRENSDAPD